MDINNEIKKKGFLDIDLPDNLDLKVEINKLKAEKNAIILGHFYQTDDIQEISDILGDSLALAQEASKTKADLIVFAGVHFMAETAKLVNPTKKVVLPDLNAGCSLADSAPADEFEKFVKAHPDHTVITYINSSTEVKALTDVCCTSSNAVHIVNSFPKDAKLIFAPDKNLGNYINKITGRNMLLWEGACHVHKEFSIPRIIELKNQYPDAKIIAHPECQNDLLIMAEHVGSTSSLLNYTKKDTGDQYIVATESGILHQMRKYSPNKHFIPAPPEDSTCACNDCKFMKMNTLRKIYLAMKYEVPEITLDEDLRKRAAKPIEKMLEISRKLGI
ncbi:quinolinate synthase NadA [Salinivirga cyanobacteriivorans]|uniref:Quinolinate synthase n=1 Tax=Salinivirga cyanobacteriivorans TaxID=1307839 RepID=A0A0S2HZX5_9BACT|nr:quinolinate synthase NadA [Salinivirga cyanobacteriivorans]ALO15705.1 Quinolinate synthase A [Salinivirga cyanobacteriivorans]